MTKKILKATHTGILKLGEYEISCAVLEGSTRIIVERSMAKALGKKGGGQYWKAKKDASSKSAILPEYVSARYLQPYMSKELKNKLENPIYYKGLRGSSKNVSMGVEATLLPDICDLWITAKENGALNERQAETANRAYKLMRGFANIGIIALVDEATGYQEIRDRLALQKILEKYISKELMPWTKRFPDEFYKEMFRLKDWQYTPLSVNRPSVVGRYTNDIVYERLAPGVLEKLKRITPRDEKGHTKHRFHQRLTDEVGHPRLAEHLSAVIALMRAYTSWDQFKRGLQRSLPKLHEQMLLDFPENQ